VRAVTNASGQVVRRHDVTPFGEEVSPTVPNPDKQLFTGHERDAETSLDYFGARYYRAQVGRFTTVDPVYTWQENLVDPQRWNRYAYVRNNPLRWTDPDGRKIQVLDAMALQFIQSTVPTELRSAITLAAGGMLDLQRLLAVSTKDENFLALLMLARDPTLIQVSSAATARYLNAAGLREEYPFSFRQDDKAGFTGATVTPGAKTSNPYDNGAVRSLSGNVEIQLASLPHIPRSEMAQTTAHELYGHALLYLQKRPYLHPDPEVERLIAAIRARTK